MFCFDDFVFRCLKVQVLVTMGDCHDGKNMCSFQFFNCNSDCSHTAVNDV